MQRIKDFVGELAGSIFGIAYMIGYSGTFVYLTFFEGFGYNWWNWLFVIPLNLILAMIWPVHWAMEFLF